MTRDQNRDELIGWTGWDETHQPVVPRLTLSPEGLEMHYNFPPLELPKLPQFQPDPEAMKLVFEKITVIVDEVKDQLDKCAEAGQALGTKTPYYRDGIHRRGRAEFKKKGKR